MVSRRNLVTVLLMMVTIFFMFQFTQVIKVRNNQYDTNEYVKESVLTANGRYNANYSNDCLVYIGSTNTEEYKAVEDWSDYSKKYLKTYADFSSLDESTVSKARMILIDAESVNCLTNNTEIEKLTKYGNPIVFVNMPSVSDIRLSALLRKLTGISNVRADEVEALGFQAFNGFLLGGEAAYLPQKEEEEKYNDLDLTVPWYETGMGTTTYVVGMMKEGEYKANEFPKLIWRNNYNGTYIYSINTDVFNAETGMGFLSAIDYTSHEYSVYPVVNAQNMVLSDYPVITEENTDEIKQIYSMDAMTLSRDITWPVFVSIATRYKLKLTCFVNTGYEYPTDKKPSDEYLSFYLQQVKEINGEFGRSLDTADIEKQFKAKSRDDEYFFEKDGGYHYASAYIPHVNDDLSERLEEDNLILSRVHTVVSNKDDNEILSYIDDSVTLQTITNVADEYTYSKELKHRCMLTSMGYSTTLIDMHKVEFPEGSDDEWQNFSKKVTANLNTFWTANDEFEYTAVSESDLRVREFLNLDYNHSRTDNTIALRTLGVDEAYYVLRTHDEDIKKISGGEYTKIEKDAFLIHVTGNVTLIELEESEDILSYKGLYH